eukprot:5044933-Ditylum_brightwellii.AAC.1
MARKTHRRKQGKQPESNKGNNSEFNETQRGNQQNLANNETIPTTTECKRNNTHNGARCRQNKNRRDESNLTL